jgi:hypothetical protein
MGKVFSEYDRPPIIRISAKCGSDNREFGQLDFIHEKNDYNNVPYYHNKEIKKIRTLKHEELKNVTIN